MNLQMNDYKPIRDILFSIELTKLLRESNCSYSLSAKKINVSELTIKKWCYGDSFPNKYNAELIQYTTGMDMKKYYDINFLKHCDDLFAKGVKLQNMV